MIVHARDAEARLLDAVNSLKGNAGYYYGLHFQLSKLAAQYKSDYQIKIAVNILRDLFDGYEGGIFIFQTADVVVLYQGEDKLLIEKAMFQLRYLFADDAIAYSEEGTENEEFCHVYDLNFRWRDFQHFCRDAVSVSLKNPGTPGQPAAKPALSPASPVAAPPQTMPGIFMTAPNVFSPARLTIIEQDLKTADLRPVIRKQPICAWVKGQNLRPVFEEVYIHIAQLRQLLGAECNFAENKGLFKYLTEVLDRHVLHALERYPGMFLRTPVSLNLNIETVLSDAFATFIESAKPHLKALVVEIQVADVFADMLAFRATRTLLQKNGFRVCLDGLNLLSFMKADRQSLGFDLAKLQWHPQMQGQLDNNDNKELARAIQSCGSNRMILCRCDTIAAVDFGHKMGISLFQGRYIDKMLDPAAKVVN